jgi:hypothetical protein
MGVAPDSDSTPVAVTLISKPTDKSFLIYRLELTRRDSGHVVFQVPWFDCGLAFERPGVSRWRHDK